MKKKVKIGIDIDEIVVEFMRHYLKFHNKNHNTNFNLNDITNYHLWKCGIHNSREESVREVQLFSHSNLFDSLSLVGGVKSSLNKVLKNYDVYFITSRPASLKEKTEKFFYSNLSKKRCSFIFSGEIHRGRLKQEICKDLGVSLMIEDNPDYALDCAKSGIKTLLLEKPWNKNYEKHEKIIKVKNWEEILEKLEL